MTHFNSGARYSGRIGDVIVVLLPSTQAGHHYIRFVSWDGDKPKVDVVPTPVFSDYIPTLLRHKGFDVDQTQWREHTDIGDRHNTRSATDNKPYQTYNVGRTAV
jgi:hypothetical protein